MTEETTPLPPRLPAGVPSVYADHLADAIYGFHTTKLVFGVEIGNAASAELRPENLRPVAVLTIPTPMLLAAAMKVLQDLTMPTMLEQTSGRFRAVMEQLELAANAVQAAQAAVPAPKVKREDAHGTREPG